MRKAPRRKAAKAKSEFPKILRSRHTAFERLVRVQAIDRGRALLRPERCESFFLAE